MSLDDLDKIKSYVDSNLSGQSMTPTYLNPTQKAYQAGMQNLANIPQTPIEESSAGIPQFSVIDSLKESFKSKPKTSMSEKEIKPVKSYDYATGKVSDLQWVDTSLKMVGKKYRSGEPAMCATFVSDMLERGGVLPKGVLKGGSYANVFEQVKSLHKLGFDKVGAKNLQKGDLVYFDRTYTPAGFKTPPTYTHVGIYIGNGEFLHRPTAGGAVQKDSLLNPYYGKKFNHGLRNPNGQGTANALSKVPVQNNLYSMFDKQLLANPNSLKTITYSLGRSILGDRGAEIFTKLIQTESGFNPNAKSPVGAIGLGQFMPGTLRGALDSYNAEQKAKGQKTYSLNDYANNPRLQIILSARHFNGLLARYKGDYAKALAAYNAGGGAVDSGKAAQYKETVNYVGNIMGISPKMAKEAILSPTPMYVHSKVSAREADKKIWDAGNKVYQGVYNWVKGMFPALKPGMDLMEYSTGLGRDDFADAMSHSALRDPLQFITAGKKALNKELPYSTEEAQQAKFIKEKTKHLVNSTFWFIPGLVGSLTKLNAITPDYKFLSDYENPLALYRNSSNSFGESKQRFSKAVIGLSDIKSLFDGREDFKKSAREMYDGLIYNNLIGFLSGGTGGRGLHSIANVENVSIAVLQTFMLNGMLAKLSPGAASAVDDSFGGRLNPLQEYQRVNKMLEWSLQNGRLATLPKGPIKNALIAISNSVNGTRYGDLLSSFFINGSIASSQTLNYLVTANILNGKKPAEAVRDSVLPSLQMGLIAGAIGPSMEGLGMLGELGVDLFKPISIFGAGLGGTLKGKGFKAGIEDYMQKTLPKLNKKQTMVLNGLGNKIFKDWDTMVTNSEKAMKLDMQIEGVQSTLNVVKAMADNTDMVHKASLNEFNTLTQNKDQLLAIRDESNPMVQGQIDIEVKNIDSQLERLQRFIDTDIAEKKTNALNVYENLNEVHTKLQKVKETALNTKDNPNIWNEATAKSIDLGDSQYRESIDSFFSTIDDSTILNSSSDRQKAEFFTNLLGNQAEGALDVVAFDSGRIASGLKEIIKKEPTLDNVTVENINNLANDLYRVSVASPAQRLEITKEAVADLLQRKNLPLDLIDPKKGVPTTVSKLDNEIAVWLGLNDYKVEDLNNPEVLNQMIKDIAEKDYVNVYYKLKNEKLDKLEKQHTKVLDLMQEASEKRLATKEQLNLNRKEYRKELNELNKSLLTRELELKAKAKQYKKGRISKAEKNLYDYEIKINKQLQDRVDSIETTLTDGYKRIAKNNAIKIYNQGKANLKLAKGKEPIKYDVNKAPNNDVQTLYIKHNKLLDDRQAMIASNKYTAKRAEIWTNNFNKNLDKIKVESEKAFDTLPIMQLVSEGYMDIDKAGKALLNEGFTKQEVNAFKKAMAFSMSDNEVKTLSRLKDIVKQEREAKIKYELTPAKVKQLENKRNMLQKKWDTIGKRIKKEEDSYLNRINKKLDRNELSAIPDKEIADFDKAYFETRDAIEGELPPSTSLSYDELLSILKKKHNIDDDMFDALLGGDLIRYMQKELSYNPFDLKKNPEDYTTILNKVKSSSGMERFLDKYAKELWLSGEEKANVMLQDMADYLKVELTPDDKALVQSMSDIFGTSTKDMYAFSNLVRQLSDNDKLTPQNLTIAWGNIISNRKNAGAWFVGKMEQEYRKIFDFDKLSPEESNQIGYHLVRMLEEPSKQVMQDSFDAIKNIGIKGFGETELKRLLLVQKNMQSVIDIIRKIDPQTRETFMDNYVKHLYPRMDYATEGVRAEVQNSLKNRKFFTLKDIQEFQNKNKADTIGMIADNYKRGGNLSDDEALTRATETYTDLRYNDKKWKAYINATEDERWQMLGGGKSIIPLSEVKIGDKTVRRIVDDFTLSTLLTDMNMHPVNVMQGTFKSIFNIVDMNNTLKSLTDITVDGKEAIFFRDPSTRKAHLARPGVEGGDAYHTLAEVNSFSRFVYVSDEVGADGNRIVYKASDIELHPEVFQILDSRFSYLENKKDWVSKLEGLAVKAKGVSLMGSPVQLNLSLNSGMFLEAGMSMGNLRGLQEAGSLSSAQLMTDFIANGGNLGSVTKQFLGYKDLTTGKETSLLEGAFGLFENAVKYDTAINEVTTYKVLNDAQLGAWLFNVNRTLNSKWGKQLVGKYGYNEALGEIKRLEAKNINNRLAMFNTLEMTNNFRRFWFSTIQTPQFFGSMVSQVRTALAGAADIIPGQGKLKQRLKVPVQTVLTKEAQTKLSVDAVKRLIGDVTATIGAVNLIQFGITGTLAWNNPPGKKASIFIGNDTYLDIPFWTPNKPLTKAIATGIDVAKGEVEPAEGLQKAVSMQTYQRLNTVMRNAFESTIIAYVNKGKSSWGMSIYNPNEPILSSEGMIPGISKNMAYNIFPQDINPFEATFGGYRPRSLEDIGAQWMGFRESTAGEYKPSYSYKYRDYNDRLKSKVNEIIKKAKKETDLNRRSQIIQEAYDLAVLDGLRVTNKKYIQAFRQAGVINDNNKVTLTPKQFQNLIDKQFKRSSYIRSKTPNKFKDIE